MLVHDRDVYDDGIISYLWIVRVRNAVGWLTDSCDFRETTRLARQRRQRGEFCVGVSGHTCMPNISLHVMCHLQLANLS